MDAAEPVRIEELLAHADWLRRLAASLVRDGAGADDLVQETWVAAIEHPPRGGMPLRPWLARVARNLAINRRRTDVRRADHESRGAHDERETLSADRIAEEIEAQRTLAGLVLSLEEPLRTTVVLRYFRGLDASAISRLQRVPAGTVRWRLKQALDRLRGELDVRFGRRDSWCIALGALCARASREAAAAGSSMAIGGTIVSTGTKIGIAALLVAIGVGVWSLWSHEPEKLSEIARVVESDTAGARLVASDSARDARRAVGEDVRGTDSPVAATSAPVQALAPSDCCIVGRVIDPDGRGVPGARVEASFEPAEDGAVLDMHRGLPGSSATTTDEHGAFSVPVSAATPFQVTCSHASFAPQTSGPHFAGDTVELTLDRGASLTVRVRVQSASKALPGALVRVSMWKDAWRSATGLRDAREPWSVETRTSADGSCSWSVVPRGWLRIVVAADGFADDETLLHVHGTEPLTATFEMTQAGVLDGVVRDALTGDPIAGATVEGRFLHATQTDSSGRFQLAIFPLDGMTREVVVSASGHAPAHAEVRFDAARRAEHLEFELQPELRVRGRVVDDSGRAVADAAIACRGNVATGPFVGTFLESGARSGADGVFELGGLTPAAYRLIARAPGYAPSVRMIDAEPSNGTLQIGDVVVAAGGEIEGTVQAPDVPASEIFVRLRIADDARAKFDRLTHVSSTRPDARGRFAFAHVPAGRLAMELVRIRKLDRGEEEQTLASATLTLDPGEVRRDVLLRAGAPAIEGVVVAPDGSKSFAVKLTGGALDWDGVTTRTDADGRFRFSIEGAGPYRVTVSDPRLFCAPKSVDGVRLGDRELRIELERFHSTHVIRGRLVDASGEPIESTYIAFTDATTGERLGRVAMPDEQGRFEMKDLNVVPYDLELFDMKSVYLPVKIEGVKPGGADVEMQLTRRK